jgi:hypothetical protein
MHGCAWTPKFPFSPAHVAPPRSGDRRWRGSSVRPLLPPTKPTAQAVRILSQCNTQRVRQGRKQAGGQQLNGCGPALISAASRAPLTIGCWIGGVPAVRTSADGLAMPPPPARPRRGGGAPSRTKGGAGGRRRSSHGWAGAKQTRKNSIARQHIKVPTATQAHTLSGMRPFSFAEGILHGHRSGVGATWVHPAADSPWWRWSWVVMQGSPQPKRARLSRHDGGASSRSHRSGRGSSAPLPATAAARRRQQQHQREPTDLEGRQS